MLRTEIGSISAIAEELGIRPQTVSGVLRGKGDSRRILEAATARALAILANQEAT